MPAFLPETIKIEIALDHCRVYKLEGEITPSKQKILIEYNSNYIIQLSTFFLKI